MCALAPLLADVTTCAAACWTLCREAEKHLKENKTKWKRGFGVSSRELQAAGAARSLRTGRSAFPFQHQGMGVKRTDVLGDISQLPLHQGKGHGKH